MPEKPTRHLPTRAEIGGEVERLRAKILQTCSEVQETSSKSLEAIARSHRQGGRGHRRAAIRVRPPSWRPLSFGLAGSVSV